MCGLWSDGAGELFEHEWSNGDTILSCFFFRRRSCEWWIFFVQLRVMIVLVPLPYSPASLALACSCFGCFNRSRSSSQKIICLSPQLFFFSHVVTDNIVIHKMSCTYKRTPSHKPNGKSIQNRGKHAHAHNKWSRKKWMILSSFALLLYLDWIS